MCVETMDTRSKHVKSDCLRKSLKPGSKLRWKQPRVFAEEDEALKRCRAKAMKSIRKCLPRGQRRSQLARLAKVLGNIGKKEKAESVCEERADAACVPSGAMAPENTTQYIMANVYEDMTTDDVDTASRGTSVQLYRESLSPRARGEDSEHDESCLAFEQRDFEEVFELYYQPE